MKAWFDVTASYDTKSNMWAIKCPDLPGVHAQCKKEKEIGDEAKAAITEYLESAASLEEPLEVAGYDPDAINFRNVYHILMDLPKGLELKVI